MDEGDGLPDKAIVVRCGMPPFPIWPLETSCDWHPAGFYGFSVQASIGLTVEQLATACFNKTVGFTTVLEIRKMGYDVIRTNGEAHHATVIVPVAWSADAADQLAGIFRLARNPRPKKRD